MGIETLALIAAGTVAGAAAGGAFSKKPAPPEAPAALEPVPSRTDPAVAQSEQRDRIRRKRGQQATYLSGGYLGDTSTPSVGVKQLLGS